MAVNPRNSFPAHRYTRDEYFALERVGEARYEYWDGEIVCMSGGTEEHALITNNLQMTLTRQLTGRACRVFGADLAIATPMLPPYRYPDLSVVCGQPVFQDIEGIATLTNPIVVVEVLSPATESRDRNEKRAAYQALQSLEDYLLVHQDAPHITHYTLKGVPRRDYSSLTEAIQLASIGCYLTLAEVYEGIQFN
jgi:Uma2 family endonuclease